MRLIAINRLTALIFILFWLPKQWP